MEFIKALGQFIQSQILGMSWLNELTAALLTALGLDVSSRWGGSLHFFLYDVIKICLCLLYTSSSPRD